ncbi:MAG: DUF2845 domain-containing protein [gamma proteobacterium symbiont of Bathyaustriella thionipta]|nr:DUF2845 domain-containing protein [gamma proteobacterium symbiont of Bathyaustriella thionipta]
MSRTCMITLILALTVTFISQSAAAKSIRCGIHVISDAQRKGPGKFEVLKKCGEPSSRQGDVFVYTRSGKPVELRFDSRGMLTSIK